MPLNLQLVLLFSFTQVTTLPSCHFQWRLVCHGQNGQVTRPPSALSCGGLKAMSILCVCFLIARRLQCPFRELRVHPGNRCCPLMSFVPLLSIPVSKRRSFQRGARMFRISDS